MLLWHNVEINETHIKGYTDRATIIQIPKNLEYGGMIFYHPSKLVRENKNRSTFGFTDEWDFTLYSKNGGRKEQIGADEMLSLFGCDEGHEASYLKVEEPAPLSGDITVNEDLKR